MNKTELIAAMAEKTGFSKKDSEKALAAVIDTIVEEVAKGEKVQLVGFGTFESRKRDERVGCDPRTKEKITIKASTVPAFKAGNTFKKAVDI